MKKRWFFIKLFVSAALVGIVYMSGQYETPPALKIRNEAMYFINHSSDIEYIAKNTYNNAKILAKIVYDKAGK